MSSTSPGIYQIPRAQGDVSRFVWIALIIFIVVAISSFVLATQYAAWAFSYNDMLGMPLAVAAGIPVYGPHQILVWTWKFNSLTYGPDVLMVFRNAHLIMGFGGLLSLLMPVTYIFLRTKKAMNARNDLHGSAHWASGDEVKAAGLLPDSDNAGGVMLGGYEGKKGALHYLRHKGAEHIMVFAPPRSGKGVGIVIPTLLSWDQSVLVHDIKGENWALTSGYREKVLGQRCLRFAPSEVGSARFNPLSEIRLDSNLVKDVQNIATIIVDPDGKGLQDHWAKTGFDLLTGVILFVLLSEDINSNDKCMAAVQSILSDGGPIRELAEKEAAERVDGVEGAKASEGVKAVMEFIRDRAHRSIEEGQVEESALVGWMSAAQAAQSFLNKAPNEASGVLSTSLSFLTLYRDPIVAENTRHSDFSIESLMQNKTSLYLVVPPSDKDRLKPLLRLIINHAVRRLTEIGRASCRERV